MELYIHIPFCIRKCAYCAFDSFAGCSREEMEKYVSAVLREACFRKPLLNEPVTTVYIGGGTPSLLPPDLTEKLLTGISSLTDMSTVSEFTAEANPGTVTEDWLNTIRNLGINRISFGVQAVQDRLLKTLGRIHRFDDVIRSVDMAVNAGFRNISMDLIFGIPGQTMEDWRSTLREILALGPKHVSAYGLIPEEGTPLFTDLENKILSLPDPDMERDMYDAAISMLSSAGLEQYEISNFAFPGYSCMHNVGYWDQTPYLGLGLSAASMILCSQRDAGCFSHRWTNPSTLKSYYELTEHPEQSAKIIEKITPDEARFETVMLSLRMNSGMDRARFRELHGNVPEYWYGDVLSVLADKGLMKLSGDCWQLTRRGMDIQNSVLLEFMDR